MKFTFFLLLMASVSFATPFVTVWKTTTANEVVKVPMIGTYDYDLDNDGTFETTNVTGTQTYTFPTIGNHTVAIRPSTGTNIQIQVSNQFGASPNTQLSLVTQWGDYTWTTMSNAFNSAINLDVTATDQPIFAVGASAYGMFTNCQNLVGNATFANWNTSELTSFQNMFLSARKFNQPIGSWNTSKVTTMRAMFFCYIGGQNIFNQDLSGWDTSKVTTMKSMFSDNPFFNGNVSNWDTSKVTTMRTMFFNAAAFNQNISNWDTAKVTDLYGMLYGTTVFNQPLTTIGNKWDVSKVTNTHGMFRGSIIFDQDLSSWNTSSVTKMSNMFKDAKAFNSDISTWNTAGVAEMSAMFDGATSFNQNLSTWNIEKLGTESTWEDPNGIVTSVKGDAKFMFDHSGLSSENYTKLLIGWSEKVYDLQEGVTLGAFGLKHGPSATAARSKLIQQDKWFINDRSTSFVTVWKTTAVNEEVKVSMVGTYDYDLDNDGTFETTNVTGTQTYTFPTIGNHTVAIKPTTGTDIQIQISPDKYGPYNTQLQLITQWGDYKWTTMDHAFHYAVELDVTATDLPDFSGMTSMEDMFYGCKKLVGNRTFADWNTSTITTMKRMFSKAEKFNQPIGSWDTSNVTNMYAMFFCWPSTANDDTYPDAFNQDISGWNTSKVTDMGVMFVYNPNFNQKLNTWDTSKVTNMSGTFYGASAFNQPLDNWKTVKVTNMSDMFGGTNAFNQNINGWNTTAVTNMSNMFYAATAFNQPLNNWNTEAVSNLSWMFEDATAFNQDISNWSISSLTIATGMLNGSNLSTRYYNPLLTSWSRQVRASVDDITKRDIIDVEFGALGLTYTSTDDVHKERGFLISHGWDSDIATPTGTFGDLFREDDSPIINPVVGVTFEQNGRKLDWTLSDQSQVVRYEIYDLETKVLITTIEKTTSATYHIELDDDRDVYLVVVDNWESHSYLPTNSANILTTYDLTKGWNLISIASHNVDLSELESIANGRLWAWDGTSYALADNVLSTDAIWVNVLKPTNINLTGRKSTDAIVLSTGWNMVGPSENTEIPNKAHTTYKYENNGHSTIAAPSVLRRGTGYWIFHTTE